MNPETLRAWQAVIRDIAIVVIGAFMLVFETVAAREPNPYLIGAGLVMLGVPPAIRVDERLRRSKTAEDTPDRWPTP